MSDFEKMLQSIINTPADQRIEEAKGVLGKCFGILSDIVDEESATKFIVTFISTALSSDGVYSAKEQAMMSELFGGIDISKSVINVDSKDYAISNAVIDELPAEKKSTFCLLAIYIMSADDELNKHEFDYLYELMKK